MQSFCQELQFLYQTQSIGRVSVQMPWHPGDVEGLLGTFNRLRCCRRRSSLPFQWGGCSSIRLCIL